MTTTHALYLVFLSVEVHWFSLVYTISFSLGTWMYLWKRMDFIHAMFKTWSGGKYLKN